MSDVNTTRDESILRKIYLEEAQRLNPPMDAERWSGMEPLEVYFEIETIRRLLATPPTAAK